MDAELTFQKDLKLIALHIVCPFSAMQTEIPEGFNRLKSRLGEIHNRLDHTQIIGFYPQSSDSPDMDNCHYYLGVEVANNDVVPEDLMSITILSGQYVSYMHKGSLESFGAAYATVNSYIEDHGFFNNLSRHVLEVKNINNDLHNRLKEDNEITLMIPVNSN
ncbi:GyrI-like domain-containing protein [Paenibacillus albus]|uniref:AraC family transcriptional regulator n=1 Tax=Paenibacillus albus TaxID=2495582 RepID=A0A3S9A2M0_9BACL|nr:GyrI-like domain-containing protein [Paenibacillus albus]AZN39926.1 AraC family transcriptional regulator [Paenibacillus albus]